AGGFYFLLERIGPLELLPGPKLDGRQPQRYSLGCQHETGVHEQSADGVGLALMKRDQACPTDRLGLFALEGELGRVVEHQDRALGFGKTSLGRGKVTCQDDLLIDSGIAKESISGLCRRPVLARGRNGIADPPSQLAK